MTLAEFKAWFEGFTEGMEGAPSANQWDRIKERVAQIDGTAITREVVYRDHYWPTIINRPLEPYISWYGAGTGTAPATWQVPMSENLVTLGKAEYSALAS